MISMAIAEQFGVETKTFAMDFTKGDAEDFSRNTSNFTNQWDFKVFQSRWNTLLQLRGHRKNVESKIKSYELHSAFNRFFR